MVRGGRRLHSSVGRHSLGDRVEEKSQESVESLAIGTGAGVNYCAHCCILGFPFFPIETRA